VRASRSLHIAQVDDAEVADRLQSTMDRNLWDTIQQQQQQQQQQLQQQQQQQQQQSPLARSDSSSSQGSQNKQQLQQQQQQQQRRLLPCVVSCSSEGLNLRVVPARQDLPPLTQVAQPARPATHTLIVM
jgi:glycyl-tRNA synthetase (class II)